MTLPLPGACLTRVAAANATGVTREHEASVGRIAAEPCLVRPMQMRSVLFGDIQVGLYASYVILIIWRGSVGIPEGYVPYIAAYFVLSTLAGIIERVHERMTFRRMIQNLVALDPAESAELIERSWSASARRLLRAEVAKEGLVEVRELTERFPMPASIRRQTDLLFWSATLAALIIFALLFVREWGSAWGWGVWVAGSSSAGLAGWLRRRSRAFASTVVVDAWQLCVERADGSHEAQIRWGRELYLTNDPSRNRIALSDVRTRSGVYLDYRRVGFVRLLNLVLERGGFRETDSSEGGEEDVQA
jgi:hypothetical protein